MSTLRRLVPLPALPLVLALLACNVLTSGSTPRPPLGTPTAAASPSEMLPGPTRPATAAPTTQVTATAAATAKAAPTGTRAPVPTRVETSSPGGVKLSGGGPWLVFSAEDGLWALNSDGSGLTQVMKPAPYFRLGPASPSGGHATLLTGSDATGFHGLTLWLLSLPGGDLKKISALTDASTEPGPNDQFGDLSIDLITPLGQAAWSPDGADLAFIGAQAGPSADLFKYNLASGQVTRLTDGPSQAYGPSWSPDGKYIVQMGAKTFGTGAGYVMDGVWAAAADNSGVKLLYTPDSGGENVVGWAGPETFAVDSFYVACAYGKVRTFNIADGTSQPIFANFYTDLATDPATGNSLVVVDQFMAECTPGAKTGLFLAKPGAPPKLLVENSADAKNLGWSVAAGLFYAFTDAGWVAYTPDGKPAQLPAGVTGEPVIGPGGKNWAWVNDASEQLEASVGGAPAQSVYGGVVTFPTWSPDGQYLLFFGDGQLYSASAQDLQPQPHGDQMTMANNFDLSEWVR